MIRPNEHSAATLKIYRRIKMRSVLAGCCLLIAVTICVAQTEKSNEQTKPDLSGTWVLDKSKSSKVAHGIVLVVVHREPEIRITEKFIKDGREAVKESIYYSDGRAESAPQEDVQSSKTKWEGRKLVRRSLKTSKGLMKIEFTTTEEWSLSEGGEKLTRRIWMAERLSTNQAIIPRIEFKYVFTRSS